MQLRIPNRRVVAGPGLAAAAAGVIAAGALVAIARPRSAHADPIEHTAGYLFHYFADSDRVHVYSNYGDYTLGLSPDARVFVQWNRELVVVPAIDAPPGSAEAVDAITSASRPVSSRFGAFEDFAKTRNEVQAELSAKHCRAGYYVSKETDYLAQQMSGNLDHDLLDGNLNVSVGSSYGWDAIEPLQDDDTQADDALKSTLHGNAVVTETLTPTTTLRVGGEVNVVRGLQHNPYRNVYAGGARIPERHPERRVRRDLYLKLHQYLMNRSSVKLDYKLYADDWGVASQTMGAKLSQYVTEKVIVGYGYRYYDQGAADFYREEYADADGVDGYRTGDYRLGAFTAHLFGTDLDWDLGRPLAGIDFNGVLHLTARYERYFNSNNFSANIFESGFAFTF